MHFAHPLPWWLAALLAAAIAAVAYGEYRRPLSPLTRPQRGVLVAMRVIALSILVLSLFRPIAILPPSGSRDAIVPILVDASRSMRLGDADGQSRVARANALLKNELGPALSAKFQTELYAVGEGLTPAKVDALTADFRRTDLTGALTAVRERYRGQRVAGIIVLSDGGDTGSPGSSGSRGSGGSRGSPSRPAPVLPDGRAQEHALVPPKPQAKADDRHGHPLAGPSPQAKAHETPGPQV